MTIMPRLFTLLAVTVLTAIPLIQAAYAQDVQLLHPADSNDDGAMSTDEATRPRPRDYAQLDAGHAGTVGQDDVVTARSHLRQGDGAVMGRGGKHRTRKVDGGCVADTGVGCMRLR
jgi:hypothetical protein